MYINVNGARLYFDVHGPETRAIDGKAVKVPTLLILHGGPGFDHMGVKAELLPLAEHFQLVWIDHRGQGRSSGSDPAEWTLAQWASDVKVFCDTLGIEKPVVLGQSFGGHVAQAYAIRYPEHPGKVIFSSIAAKWDRALAVQRFGQRGGEAVRVAADNMWSRMNEQDWADYLEVCYPYYTAGANPNYVRAPVITKFEVLRHYLQPGGEFQSIDLRPELARVRCPVLVLAGTEDPVIPWELSKQLAESVTAAPVRYVQMDGCGHGVWRDAPEQARAVIREFIES
jgi:proline iminopeptidase